MARSRCAVERCMNYERRLNFVLPQAGVAVSFALMLLIAGFGPTFTFR